jgi:hypothetical protein
VKVKDVTWAGHCGNCGAEGTVSLWDEGLRAAFVGSLPTFGDPIPPIVTPCAVCGENVHMDPTEDAIVGQS